MSECVVRMEMNGVPDCCGLCDPLFAVVCATKHDQTIDKMMLRAGRPSWCPIICQLPEGHGRLVDADAFEKDVSDALVYGLKEIPSEEGKQIFHVLMQEVLDNVKKRETIVPAERSET